MVSKVSKVFKVFKERGHSCPLTKSQKCLFRKSLEETQEIKPRVSSLGETAQPGDKVVTTTPSNLGEVGNGRMD